MIKRIIFTITILGIILSLIGDWLDWSTAPLFLIYSLTIIGLATYMGRATESIAIIVGPRIGGLLNATFGNAVELIISIFSLKAGYTAIVLASMTGSVIGNLLLVAGLSFFVGGLKHKRQRFSVHDARHNSGLLMLGVVVAFVFPHIFTVQTTEAGAVILSISVAIILIILYLLALFFRLVTQRGVYPTDQTDVEEEPEWGKRTSFVILLLSTISVAFISEKLVHTFESIAETFGWSDVFIGVIVVAVVGNAAEHASAIYMAYRDKMNVSMEIAIGSSIQIAMFVVPTLVLLSFLFQTPMPLVFTVPELISMVLAVLLTVIIINDGDTNWLEGATLLAAYFIMGIGFYLI